MNADTLSSALSEAFGSLAVEAVSDSALRVLVPSGRHSHDVVAIGLERYGDGWLVTDGGQLEYLVEGHLPRLVDLLECAGAPFSLTSGRVVTLAVPADGNVADAVLSFAHHLLAAPVVWQALECAKPGTTAPSSVDVMARETKARVVDALGDRAKPYLHLRYDVLARDERFPAPLAVASPAPRPHLPRLVASFIDTTAPKNAVTAAKRSASFMLDVVSDLTIPKYIVVRGDDREVDHFGDFFDPAGGTSVSSVDLNGFVTDTDAAISAIHSGAY